MTQDIIELIQGEVDGVNTPEQQETLRQACQADPDVQTELESALEVGRILDAGIRGIEPSATFTARVMDSLPAEPAWAKTRAPIRRRSASIFRLPARPVFNLAYGLVAGALVAVAVMSSIDPQAGGFDNISGTMAGTDSHIVDDTITLSTGGEIGIQALETEDAVHIQLEGELNKDVVITISVGEVDDILFEKTISPTKN